MKFISWNVNGFRACLQKGFKDFFDEADADIFCLQETKMQPGQADFKAEGYFEYYFSAEKKGYSGTAVFSKKEPLNVFYGLDGEFMDEGRVITLEFDDFYFITSYTPNAQPKLKRIGYRMEFEDALRTYMTKLSSKKAVILCGDLNVAFSEIDLKNPKSNVGNPGFSDEERGKFGELLEAGFTDTFRHLYPDKKDAYTWWSYRFSARSKNIGWRIDYFVISEYAKDKIQEALIYNDVMGSDHCPVGLIADF